MAMDEKKKPGLTSYAPPDFSESTNEISAALKAWKGFCALAAQECLDARGRAYSQAVLVRNTSFFRHVYKSLRAGSWLGILYFCAFAGCLHAIGTELTLEFILILAGCQVLLGLGLAAHVAAHDRAIAARVYADPYFEAEWLLIRVAAAIPPVAEKFFTNLSKEAAGHCDLTPEQRKRALATLEQGVSELKQAISVYEKLISWRNAGILSEEEKWRQTLSVRFFCQQLFHLRKKINQEEYR